MKKALIILSVFTAINANSTDLPKVCLGQYETKVPAFEFVQNDMLIKASSYNVKLVLFKDYLKYFCGSMEFTGFYEEIDDSSDEVNLSVSITNNISVDFDFELLLNKKTKSIQISGLKGVPVTKLPKSQIKLTSQ